MAITAITILPAGTQDNVASAMSGTTPQLVGYRNGEVPLALQVKGAPVDCSEFSQLTLWLDVISMTNRHGYEAGVPGAATLHVAIEHAPTASGPWKKLHAFTPTSGHPMESAIVHGIDNYVRASWYWARHAYPPATITDEVSMSFGVRAHAI